MGTPEAMTPIELMRHRNSLMHSEESVRKGREFATRSTDVFIVTYPKCVLPVVFPLPRPVPRRVAV